MTKDTLTTTEFEEGVHLDKISVAQDLIAREEYAEAVDVLYPTVEPLESLYRSSADVNVAHILARVYDTLADCFIPLSEYYGYRKYHAASEADRALRRELELRMDIGTAANHENMQFEADVAQVSLRLAKFHTDPVKVQEFFDAGVGLLEAVVGQDEAFKDQLALAYYDQGAWYLVKRHDWARARVFMEKASDIYEVLYEDDPDAYGEMKESCDWAMFAINMASIGD